MKESDRQLSVVYFQNDTLEMHYNFWDDPEPHPDAGTIFLVLETAVGIDDQPVSEYNPDKSIHNLPIPCIITEYV